MGSARYRRESERLAAALAAMDPAAIGRALRQDFVVVPLMRGPEGETQTRVVEAGDPEGDRRWELHLFSSSQTFAAWIGENTDAGEFALQRGTSLIPLLDAYGPILRRVLFDTAGPHPVQVAPEDVRASLEPQPGDDDVRWITEGPDAQLSGVAPAPVLRGQLTAWLRQSARTAAGADGRAMAYLTRRTEDAAASVAVTTYWQPLGAPPAGGHLAAMGARLNADKAPGDLLVEASTAAGPLLRLTHRRLGPPELAAAPVGVIDYWLQFPDGRGLCLVSFSTPHLEQLDAVQRLADAIVLAAAWDLEPSPDSAESADG